MNISAPFILRPVATSLIAVAALLCGILGYWRLPVSAMPQVDFPTIQITTRLPGANPDTIAAIVTATAMAIFSGDIPGALLRIPGTPASAAYTDESYRMTLKGQAELALGAGLVFSAIGGLFGTIVMILFSPGLAEIALKFSSFEYFWLVVLGLAGAVFIGNASVLKASVANANAAYEQVSKASKQAIDNLEENFTEAAKHFTPATDKPARTKKAS